MTAVIIILGMIAFLYLVGYRYYVRRFDRDVVKPDDSNEMPAFKHKDGVDFFPAPEPVLFGHHFSSIAGAGPIIGPIVALMNFGWAAALGWIALGSVFIGGIHDYIALMLSARNDGESIADVSRKCMGEKAKLVLSGFTWITLVLIVSVFGVLAAKTMVASPQMVIPTLGLILVAVLFGQMVYRYKFPLVWGTILAVLANIILILVGSKLPIVLPKSIMGLTPTGFWFVVIMIYCCIASSLPVQVLLQPRDYISTFNLYSCLLLGIAAILVVRPVITAPAFISFNSAKGPLYPMLFILLACGAVSGFHALVAGGTTSKQLSKESFGKPIAYGGMLTEGVLATMTLVVVAGGLYWAAPEIGNINMSELGLHQVFNKGGWILVFGNGFGNLVYQMMPFISRTIWSMLAMIALNTFILTTTDTATRISRFVVQETLGDKFKIFKNQYAALAICIIPIFYIGYTNSYSKVWPVFGAANQLIAALTMFVASAYLLSKKKPTAYTLYPGIFMLITTILALLWQGYHFIFNFHPNFTLGIVCLVLLVLAVFVSYETWVTFRNFRAGKEAGETGGQIE